jgi:hypothetical protein
MRCWFTIGILYLSSIIEYLIYVVKKARDYR